MTNIVLITFFVSFVLIVAMILNKFREIQTGSGFVSWSPNADDAIRKQIFIAKKFTTEFPMHFSRECLHFSVQKLYLVFTKARDIVYPKVAHIIDAVKGKNIPQNKGGTSFFLVNVQEHKDSLKK